MIRNAVKQKLKKGIPCVGLISNLSCAQLTEIFGIAGFDFIIYDMEHSTISEETLEGLVRAAKLKGLVPMARIRKNDSGLIMGALDAGCLGVMIPHVESREEAEQAVEHTQYPPLGHRGVNWKTIAGEWGSIEPTEYLNAANDEIMTMIQIETLKGLENVEEIVKVQKIDVLIIGPTDLSVSMGYPGQTKHPEVLKAIDKIMGAAKKYGIVVGDAGSGDRGAMSEAQKKGVLLFLSNPAAFILDNSIQIVKSIKKTFI
jgi:4-hydroxy-2-oxoheptanedioate aldolase